MENRQISLRERCILLEALTRRRRFLLGATAPGEMDVPPLARATRLVAVCGFLVVLTAPPARAQCPPTVPAEVGIQEEVAEPSDQGEPAGATSCVPPPTGMVAWWPGEQTPDDIVGGHHGVLYDDVGYTAGKVGEAFHFDYGRGRVEIAGADELNPGPQGYTFDAWVWPSVGGIASKVGAFELFMDGAPDIGHTDWALELTINGTSGPIWAKLPFQFPPYPWVHVAFVLQPDGSGQIYANGQQLESFNYTSTAGPGPLIIGYYGSYGPVWAVDEVEIFNRPLSQQEIKAIFDAGSAGKCKTDVWVQDTPYSDPVNTSTPDRGYEPDSNMNTKDMWLSRDIWIRNLVNDPGTNQNYLDNQDPVFGQVNEIYVNVRNRGTEIANTTDVLVYWAHAATGLSWPSSWSLIGSAPITNLAPSVTTEVRIPWSPNGTGHYCLLVRLINPQDPITNPETCDVHYNTRYNNNIAWRNIAVVNLIPGIIRGHDFLVRNVKDAWASVDLVFDAEGGGGGIPFLSGGGSVSVTLTQAMFEAWQSCGDEDEDVGIARCSVGSCFSLTESLAKIQGICMESDEAQLVTMYFTPETPDDGSPPAAFQRFVVRQFSDGQTTPDGGVTFELRFGEPAIPAVSEWGLVILTLLLLTGAKIYFARRKAARA